MPDVAPGLAAGPRPFGLILAGGRATRMGGGAKALHLVGGRTIFSRITDRLAVQCDGWALNAPESAAAWAGDAACILPDAIQGFVGPLAGVLAGLRHLVRTGRPDHLLLTVPGDAPFLPPDLAARLSDARRITGSATAFAASGERHHPVTALWPVAAEPMLAEALGRGSRGVEALHEQVGFAVATWSTEPLDPFFNVNTPDDLAEADRLARLCGS